MQGCQLSSQGWVQGGEGGVLTNQEALDLIRKLLKARDDAELKRLVASSLGDIDAAFFSTAEAAAQQLEHESKPEIARALRHLTDRMLSMKTLI